jgi:hypothetical protein
VLFDRLNIPFEMTSSNSRSVCGFAVLPTSAAGADFGLSDI